MRSETALVALTAIVLFVACGGPVGNTQSSTAAAPQAQAAEGSESSDKGGVASKYESAWTTDFNIEISKALAANDITGCGEYKFKASREQSREFIVYCTSDGKNWTAYLVWTGIDKAMGPYPPDPALE